LSERIAASLGLHFTQDRWRELEAGIRVAARELGMPDVVAWVQRLLDTPIPREVIEVLAAELTIGETYFFREARSFDVIGDQILPELIRARRGAGRRLRIWSAGCCTGEEPYSIAILLDRILPDLRDWQLTLLATDVNPRFLRKAAAGVYSGWSFRDAPPWLERDYFEPVAPNRFAILPRIKRLVTFGYLNLATDAYPTLTGGTHAMDLIFCRNVLMYFPPDAARRVVQSFHHALLPTGWLLLGGVETCSPFMSGFEPTSFEGATLYGKSAAASLERAANTTAAVSGSAWLEEPASLPASEPRNEPQPGGDAATVYSEAMALFDRGAYGEAARKLTSSPAISAPTVETSVLLARICANLGDLAEARHWAERAIAADKVDASLHYLRAVILREQGLIQDACDSLKRAVYLAPDFVLAHFAQGSLAQQRGRHDEARRHFANTLELLEPCRDDEVLPHSDGLAVGCLRKTIRSVLPTGVAA
jgi:chemotaxis protein methyltransferase CheR